MSKKIKELMMSETIYRIVSNFLDSLELRCIIRVKEIKLDNNLVKAEITISVIAGDADYILKYLNQPSILNKINGSINLKYSQVNVSFVGGHLINHI